VSGLFRGFFGGLGGGGRGSSVADIVPRARGAIAWELPEPVLYLLDGRRDFLLRIDATLVNAGREPLELMDALVADAGPAWDAPRAQWFENGMVRRAVFRVVPWLPCTLAPGARRAGSRLLFVVPTDRVPARGTAKIALRVVGEPFGSVEFEVRASRPVEPMDATAGI
jgi:hypothetical protein